MTIRAGPGFRIRRIAPSPPSRGRPAAMARAALRATAPRARFAAATPC